MDFAEDNCNWATIRQRVSLQLNGKTVPDSTLTGGQDGEAVCRLFRISWAPALSAGTYAADFRIQTDSGEMLEYSWQFTIKD